MDIGSAILAGLVATAVMTTLMYAARIMGMPMDMPRMLELMFSEPENTGAVYALGFIAHFMMGVIFAIVYALAFELLGISATWLWGATFGVIHGLMVGMSFAMMPAMHPRMGEGQVLSATGLFGKAYSPMMPAGVIMLHVVFGVTIGIIY